MFRNKLFRLASLHCFFFSFKTLNLDSRPPRNHHHQFPRKIHLWHLQSQPEFKERFPDVRDPEDREQKN